MRDAKPTTTEDFAKSLQAKAATTKLTPGPVAVWPTTWATETTLKLSRFEISDLKIEGRRPAGAGSPCQTADGSVAGKGVRR
jgi:hypothetical protein